MDIKKAFQTDAKKEVEGVRHDLGDGAWVVVARNNNPNAKKMAQRLLKPYKQQMARGSISEEVTDTISLKVLAKHILLDFGGIKEDGKEVEYNEAESTRLLTEYPDFRDLISNLSMDMEAFKASNDEETLGNS